MPTRRRKKKSADSGSPAQETAPRPEPSQDVAKEGAELSAPKKKRPRRRRKKPAEKAAASTEEKPAETEKKPAPKRRPAKAAQAPKRKQSTPRKSYKQRQAEAEAEAAAEQAGSTPVRGRRIAAAGRPRKGRSSSTLLPPTPPARRPAKSEPVARRPKRTERAPADQEPPAGKLPVDKKKRSADKLPASVPETEGRRETRPGKSARDSSAGPKRKQTSRRPKPEQPDRKKPVAEKTRAAAKPERKESRKPTEKKEPVAKKKRETTKAKPPAEKKAPPKRKTRAESPERKEPAPPKVEEAPRKRKRGEAKAKDRVAERQEKPVAERRVAEKRKPRGKKKDLKPFGDLELSDTMLEALADAGYEDPTPVQAGMIPMALMGRDLMGQARTGTGKTAAFGIPLLEMFAKSEKQKEPGALILVPTRELAVQVRDEIAKLAGHSRMTATAVYGGKPIRGQIEHLRRGTEIVVGTPGRVIDLIDRRALILSSLKCVVLDEADRMLDIGFRPDIEKILRRCPQSRQTLLLSATIPPPVKRLAERYMHEPEMLDFSPQDVAVETIEQFYFTVDPRQKFDLLLKLIEREDPAQAIVFCRTKKGCDRIGSRLSRKFKGAAVIHGDLQQRQRDRVMADFRAGKVRILIATDVVGRGIDVSGISHIINFDIPEFCDDYVHRVGRTGRMGREGVAYSFVTPEEGNQLTRIEIRINRLLKRDEFPGFLAIPKPEATEDINQTEPGEQPKPKPVFGKRTRRIRRAL